MKLTTKTAEELRQLKFIPSDEYCGGKISGIIELKNELKEMLDDKYPDEPILKYYERIYIKLMTLKTEIESVEKE